MTSLILDTSFFIDLNQQDPGAEALWQLIRDRQLTAAYATITAFELWTAVGFSEEDAGYIADIPDLPHCAAFGQTQEQALAEVLKAKTAWIEAARAEGKPVPPPCFRQV